MYFIAISFIWFAFFLFLSPILYHKKLQNNLSLSLILIICGSLVATFLLKIFFFYFKINLEKFLFSLMFIFFFIIFFFYNRKNLKFNFYLNKYSIFLIIIFCLISITVTLDNSVSFTHWDSVVSWNRWANELTKFEYNTSGAFYPILWPSIWSLIYELQLTSEFEFIAKTSLLVTLAILFLSIYFYSVNVSYLSGLVLIVIFIINYKHTLEFLVSGYMDQPVTILISSFLVLFSTLPFIENAKYKLTLISCSAIISLSILTKQPALIVALFYGLYLFLSLKKKKINFNFYCILNSIIFIPYIFFLIFFFNANGLDNLSLSSIYKLNFENYSKISITVSKTDFSFLVNGLNTLLTQGGIFFTFFIFFPYFFTFFIKNKKLKIINFNLILINFIGLLIYAKCCSYEIRNSYWLLGISLVSIANIFSIYTKRFNFIFFSENLVKFYPIKFILILSIIFFFLIFIQEYKNGFIIKKHISEKKNLGGKENAILLQSEFLKIDHCFIVYAAQQLIKYNHYLKEYEKSIKRTSIYNLEEIFNDNYKNNTECFVYYVFYEDISNIGNNKIILQKLYEKGVTKLNKNIYKIQPGFSW